MPISKAKLKAIMNQHGVPTATQQAVIDDVIGTAAAKKGTEHAGYGVLLADLAKVRDTMRTNMSNRKPELRPMYEEYVTILDKVRERIHIARLHGSLAEATAAAALVNEQRAAEGREPGPDNSATWQSWVPPHIKTAFTNKAAQTYARIGMVKGNRFVPFIPATEVRAAKKHAARLGTTLRRIRETHEAAPGAGVAYTPYRALYLCAARMAERELARRVKAFELGTADPVTSPLPVNWLALLDAPMRARLRAAQENPADVSAEGLADFLTEAPDNVLQDMHAFDVEHAQAQEISTSQAL